MAGCRVPGPTCAERSSGTATPGNRHTTSGDARPLGADPPAPVAGPTLTGWPRTIGWDEFQELPRRPVGVNEDAQISSELEQPPQVGVAREGGRFRLDSYEAVLSVKTSDSWVVASTKSAALLTHEQGHYDITGLVARDLIADLRSLRAATTAALEREVKGAIRRADTLADSLTQRYDTDTDHGRTQPKQDKWNALLQAAMKNGTRLTGGPT